MPVVTALEVADIAHTGVTWGSDILLFPTSMLLKIAHLKSHLSRMAYFTAIHVIVALAPLALESSTFGAPASRSVVFMRGREG